MTKIYRDEKANYRFDCEVIDLRTDERMHIAVDANTKASAAKKCRELGYKVMSMGFA